MMHGQSAGSPILGGNMAMLPGNNLAPPASPQRRLSTPLHFTPFVRPMVWGGRRLGEALDKRLPGSEPCGESWEVSDHALHHSVVADGPHAGQTLRDLMVQQRPALLGPVAQSKTFPWLIKFLDACDWLSVQVHPSDETVSRLWPGEGGKTEAWFILDAVPGSRIFAGLAPGVGEQKLRAALQTGNVTGCLHSFEPRPGDCVFLPAGAVHAVGGGVLMAEIQQTSDATFRLFDWNRLGSDGKPRTLHIEQGLQAIDWSRGPVEPVRVSDYLVPLREPRCDRTTLVYCPYFTLEHVRAGTAFPCAGDGRLHALIVVRGQGVLETGTGTVPLRTGQTWLLPAAMPSVRCTPQTELSVLVASLP